MLQQDAAEDFVIATGETHTLEEFIAETFAYVGLDRHAHVVTDPSLMRPSEIMVSKASPANAHEKLGWQAKSKRQTKAPPRGRGFLEGGCSSSCSKSNMGKALQQLNPYFGPFLIC
jgi:hypothetical protein